MKVLLFCPTHRLETETLDSIMRVDPAGHQLHIMFTRHNPARTGHYNILYNYRQGRQVTLDGGYDAMLTVESDMIVPPNCLRRLAQADADVALGLYVHRHQPDWQHSDYNPTLPFDVTQAPWINSHPELWASCWGKVIDVTGSGLGCALIHRRVLEKVQFRLLTFGGKWITADCDSHFFPDVASHNYRIVCDTTVICGHKRPDGMILWPTRNPSPTLTPGDLSRLYHMESITYGTTNA